MSIKAVMADILRRELVARNVKSLQSADCTEIVETLLEQLTDLELKLATQKFDAMPENR